MSLQTVLEGISKEQRLPFLRKAYRPERRDVAEALLGELEPGLRIGSDFYKKDERIEFDEVIGTLIKQAEEAGDNDKAKALRFQQITSHFYADDIGSAAKSSGNPELVERTIEHYRAEYFNKAEMVIGLLEHLGRKDEAREYSLKAAKALRKTNGGYTASQIYLSLEMFKEAIEVKLDNKDFDEAIKLAQEHLSEEELPQLYRRVFEVAEGEGYDKDFPVQISVAKLLGEEDLERKTKKKYVDFVMKQKEAGYLDLIREVGTEKQLRDMHTRIIAFYQQDGFEGCMSGWIKIEPESLAKAAEEAFKDTQQVKYASIAMGTYEKIGDFQKALEFARVADPKKAIALEEVVSLMIK